MRLWVRETWCETEDAESDTPVIAYRAGGIIPIGNEGGEDAPDYLIHSWANNGAHHEEPWHPSIFMPRWASRITLEITDVRVQRLQEISEEDARSEGVSIELLPELKVPHHSSLAHLPAFYSGPRDIFATLWESINAKRAPWDSNPWVWAITFKRV